MSALILIIGAERADLRARHFLHVEFVAYKQSDATFLERIVWIVAYILRSIVRVKDMNGADKVTKTVS